MLSGLCMGGRIDMGVCTEGGMIIGCLGADINEDLIPEWADGSIIEWLVESHFEMTDYSPYYDASPEDMYFGYAIPDVAVEDIKNDWLEQIQQKATDFEAITGQKAYLIGTAHIY